MSEKHLFFMYGTLKSDEVNHHYIASSNPDEFGQLEYLGRAQTVDKWPLLVLSDFRIPCILYKQDYGKHVIGELIRVDNKLRDRLDYLEALPCTFKYDRYEIQVLLAADGTRHTAWCYMVSEFKPELLDLDTITEFNGTKHGYVKESVTQPSDYDPNVALNTK